jgi:hypothetical protein
VGVDVLGFVERAIGGGVVAAAMAFRAASTRVALCVAGSGN